MPTDIQLQAADLQRQIYAEDYYQHLWVTQTARYKMTRGGIENCLYPDRDIINLCQSVWDMLPDSGAIRRPPFSLLCSIAEHIFDS